MLRSRLGFRVFLIIKMRLFKRAYRLTCECSVKREKLVMEGKPRVTEKAGYLAHPREVSLRNSEGRIDRFKGYSASKSRQKAEEEIVLSG